MMHRDAFRAEDEEVVLELDLAPVVAAIIEWHAERGELDDESDPVFALLEPLQAHYGLGRHPDSHICECFAPFDPTRAPGFRLIRLRSGHVRHARVPGVPADNERAGRALHAFLDEVAQRGQDTPVETQPLDLLGVLVAEQLRRDLFVFGDPARPGRYDSLILDSDGTAYIPKRDGRRRHGYRWDPTPAHEAHRRSLLQGTLYRGAVA
jgi:hypothetical protein